MRNPDLVVTVREVNGGLPLVFEWIVGVHPEGALPIYRCDYVPASCEATRRLALGLVATKRFVDYFDYFNAAKKNLGATDCLALAAYISSGSPLETLEGENVEYCLRGRVKRAELDNLRPGTIYACGDPETGRLRHAMIGLGGDQVLSQFGRRHSVIGISAVKAAIGVYGGTVYQVVGSVEKR